jgi:hypothetical protein
MQTDELTLYPDSGAIQVRSGLQRTPSNHDLTRISKRRTPGEGWDKILCWQ